MKKIISLTMIFVMAMASIFMLSGCGTKIYTSGDFKYWRASKNAYICDLSEEGMEKKIIAIPETIDNYIVNGLEKKNNTYSSSMWYSKNLEKIYIPKDIFIDKQVFTNCSSLKKIIICYEINIDYFIDFSMALDFNYNNISYLYINKIIFDKYSYMEYVKRANVNYYYNYIDSDNNGIFWLDDYDNEQISFIPPEPVRDGYTFEGWYKEAECKTKWNFDIDKVPAKIYDEEENYEFIETCIYAKWI